MMDNEFKKRMNAMADALDKLQSMRAEERARLAAEEEVENSDLIADMLMEISDLLAQASDLSAQAAALICGEDIEADCCSGCCFPHCCVTEVFYDDEL